MKYCTKCGKPIEDFADVCIHCGEYINQKYAPKKENKTINNTAVFYGVFAVIVMIIFIVAYFAIQNRLYDRIMNF